MASKQVRMVNIPRRITNQFYRYKMPELITKVESRGNGIKTVLVNLSDIAKALARPTTYPCRYIGYTLGALVDMNETTDRFIVNGKHSDDDLNALLDGFIDKYVLCKHCGNPETILTVSKDQSQLRLKCKACGGLTKVDATDQLGKFIARNPPPKNKDMMVEESRDRHAQEDEGDDARNEAAAAADAAEAAAAAAAADGTSASKAKEDDDEEWSLDTTEEAVAARRREAGSLAAAMPHAALFELKPPATPPSASFEKQLTKRVASDITKLYKRNAGKGTDTMVQVLSDYFKKVDGITAYVLVNAFIAGAIVPKGEHLIENSYRCAAHIAPFVTGKEDVQHVLLNALDRARERKLVSTKNMPTAIKQYYDVDALEEDFILSWYDKHADKESGKAIKPFVDWLRTAEVADS